jgi:hypothetical protein
MAIIRIGNVDDLMELTEEELKQLYKNVKEEIDIRGIEEERKAN